MNSEHTEPDHTHIDAEDLKEVDAIMAFRLPPSLAKTLMLLYREKLVSARDIEVTYHVASSAKTVISRLKSVLAGQGYTLAVEQKRITGYWLTEPHKDALRAHIQRTLFKGVTHVGNS